MYPKQKSYLHVFINCFYNFKTFNLSFKYPKQKSKQLFFINYFSNFKNLNYSSCILNRNPTYFLFYKLFL